MITACLPRMRCPCCFGDLAVQSVARGTSEIVEFGIIRCRCSQYPVIQGILLLGKRDTQSFVPFLARADIDGLLEHIAEKRWAGAGWFAAIETEWGPRDFLARAPETLFAAADRFREYAKAAAIPVVYELMSHLKYFHATPKYLAALSLVELLSRRRAHDQVTDHVIDLGAGAGHFGELALRHAKPTIVYLVDVTFRSLLMSRWMFPDPSRCMCVRTDLNLPLPFKDGAVDAAVSADAIHYVEAKASLFREVKRVLRPDGSMLFTHLHNAEHPTEPAQGSSLTADTWKALFAEALGGSGRLISDDIVRQTSRAGRPLDAAAPSGELSGARSFSFVSPGELLDAVPVAEFLRGGLEDAIWNPAYSVTREGDAFHLVRAPVTPIFDEEHATMEPLSFTVSATELAGPAERAMLRRRGILVDAPRAMCDQTDRRPG
ncbi:MAG: hypothetical protein JWO36_4064 [Myxococcales bacterium]|nr:hypothetical protein [Myxococcales bacterium]